MIKIKLKSGKKISMSEDTALELYLYLAHHFNNIYKPFYTIHTVPISPEIYPKPEIYGWRIE
jgi:hypothetical protein